MRSMKSLILISLLATLVLIQTTITTARERASYSLPTNINVWMYRLTPDGARREPFVLCASGDKTWGCTAFCDDRLPDGQPDPAYPCDRRQTLAYPYVHGPNEPATVALETDYLMDVVPQEMDPILYPNLPALQAQTIAARTFAYWHIGHGSSILTSCTGYGRM